MPGMRGWARLGAWGGPSRCVALRAWFDTLTTNGSECTTNGRRARDGRGRGGRGCGAAWWGTRARGSRLPLKGSRDPRARDVAIFGAAGWRDAEADERVPQGCAGWGGGVVRLGSFDRLRTGRPPTANRRTTNGRQRVRKGRSVDRNRAKRVMGIGTSGCSVYSDSVRYPGTRGKGRGAVASGRWSVVSEEGVGSGRGLGRGRLWAAGGGGEAAPGTAGAGNDDDASNASSACIAGSPSNAGDVCNAGRDRGSGS